MPQQQSISRRQETDSFEKNIRRQIDGMKEQLQKLSENEELDPKEKMKKKEEITRQISELETQLTEHKAQKKEEEQEQKVQKEQPNRDRFEKSDGSAENMKDVLSADVSLKKASAREGAANSLERISRTLESEIRQDKRRGISTERKEADLAEIHSRLNKVNRQTAEEAGKIGNKEYLKNLQKQVPYIKLQIGDGINTNNDGKVNVVDVNPKLLEKMQNDPNAAKEYTQRLKDVELCAKFFDNFYSARGYTVVCRHDYLDENGNFSNFSITVKKDELNEKLRSEAQENTEKRIERSREKARENAEQLAEKLEKTGAEESTIEN